MSIKILPAAQQFNCHWYCEKVGEIFKVNYFDKKLKCYAVLIDNVNHLVYEKHAGQV